MAGHVNIFKQKYKRNGQYFETLTYYCRFYENGKRILFNTTKTNKREAQTIADREAQKRENEKQRRKMEAILKSQNPIENNKNISLLNKIKKDGWLVAETNPKYIYAQSTKKETYGLKQAKQVASVLKRFLITKNDEIGSFSYTNITKKDTSDFRQRLTTYNEFPDSIKNEFLKALRAIYTWLMKTDNNIENNPFKSALVPDFGNRQKPKKKIFTFENYQMNVIFNKKYLSMLKFEPDDPPIKMADGELAEFKKKNVEKKTILWLKFLEEDYFKAIQFIAMTGLRSAECRAILRKQISNDRILTIDRAFKQNNTRESSIGLPKCDKVRTIVLADCAYEVIADKLQEKKPDKFLFVNRSGKPLDSARLLDKFNYWISVVGDKFDIRYDKRNQMVSIHTLRRTLNSLLLERGTCRESFIRQYLGWNESENSLSRVQSAHYTNLTIDAMTKVANDIEKILTGREMMWKVELASEDTQKELEFINRMKKEGLLNSSIEQKSAFQQEDEELKEIVNKNANH